MQYKDKKNIIILEIIIIIFVVVTSIITLNKWKEFKEEVILTEVYNVEIIEKYKAIGVFDTIDYAIVFRKEGEQGKTISYLDKAQWDLIEKDKKYKFTAKYTREKDRMLEIEEIKSEYN